MDSYLGVLKKYAVFGGRAPRKEFWTFVLINAVISVIVGIAGMSTNPLMIPLIGLGYLYGLVILIPSIAVTVRRLHDTNRSGWWILIGLIPLVGTIILIVFTAQDSQSGENRYGPNPGAA